MIKKTLSAFTFFILLFSSTSSIAFATNSVQSDISKNKIKFQQMNKNLMETNKQIADLNTEMTTLNNSISKNNIDITEVETQTNTKKIQIEKLTQQVNTSQQLANKRFRAIYIHGYGENFIELLLTTQSFTDFYSKFEAMETIMSFDKKTFNDLKSKKRTTFDSINKLNLKSKQLQQLKISNSSKVQQLNDKKEKLQALSKQFTEQINSATPIINRNEEQIIAYSISVIASQGSTVSDMKNALQTLKSLSSQLRTDSAIKKTMDSIDSGNKKLATMASTSEKPNISGNYKATYTMEATAYAGDILTALGLKTCRDPGGLSSIAVDPNVIPLGTKVYIPGYGYAICSDTGGLIKGNIIDLFMDSEEECMNWGRQPVTVHIVAYPGEW